MGKEIHLYLPLRWAAKDKKTKDADPLKTKMAEYERNGYKFTGGWDSPEMKVVAYKNPTTNHRVELQWNKKDKRLAVKDGFEESKHPRSNNGQFGSGGGNKSDREVKMSAAAVKSVSAGLKKNLQAARSEKVSPAQRAAATAKAKVDLERHVKKSKDAPPEFRTAVNKFLSSRRVVGKYAGGEIREQPSIKGGKEYFLDLPGGYVKGPFSSVSELKSKVPA